MKYLKELFKASPKNKLITIPEGCMLVASYRVGYNRSDKVFVFQHEDGSYFEESEPLGHVKLNIPEGHTLLAASQPGADAANRRYYIRNDESHEVFEVNLAFLKSSASD